jgi:hypothetical protein
MDHEIAKRRNRIGPLVIRKQKQHVRPRRDIRRLQLGQGCEEQGEDEAEASQMVHRPRGSQSPQSDAELALLADLENYRVSVVVVIGPSLL